MRILFPPLASNALFLSLFGLVDVEVNAALFRFAVTSHGAFAIRKILLHFPSSQSFIIHSLQTSVEASTFPIQIRDQKKKKNCEIFQSALPSHSTSLSFSHFNPSLSHTATHVCSTFHTQFNVGRGTGEWIFILRISVRFFSFSACYLNGCNI